MAHNAKRPGTVTAAAVILFIVGGYSLLIGTCSGGMTAVNALQAEPQAKRAVPAGKVDAADPAAVQRFMADEVPGFTIVSYSLLGIDILLGVGQIICGVGLLRMSGAARLMAILLTLIKLLFSFAGHAYQVIYVIPATTKLLQMNIPQQAAPFDFGRLMQALSLFFLLIIVVIQLAIVISVIWLLCTARARAAFAGKTPPVLDEEDRFRRRAEGYQDNGPGAPPDTGITDRPSPPPDTGITDRP